MPSRNGRRFLCLLAILIPSFAAAAAAPDAFLGKYCAGCHNDKLKVASLSLDQTPATSATWEKIIDKIATNRMPPPGTPMPAPAERTAELAALARFVNTTAPVAPHLTAHRLNRAEYNNTVRDLLGVSLRPADEFPLDDAGYGFDNIGDVLSVSPLLMEKYMAAARTLSRAAVYGEEAPAKPTKLVRYMTKKSQDDPTPNALPFSIRGAIYGTFDFPTDGEYEFRMRVGNYRPRTPGKRNMTLEEHRLAYPPVTMVMTFDGAPILTEVVEGDIDYQYAHGESIARVRATAGVHAFRASFPEFANASNPRDNINLDGRRKLFIDYVDIVGPFPPVPVRTRNPRIFLCTEQTPECARRIITDVASRALRGQTNEQRLEQLTSLAALVRRRGDSFDESIRVAIQAILVSPAFLFRVDNRSPYDLAARLSYFLWSSTPDAELLRAAEHHEELSTQVPRLLKDLRSQALIENFVGQWLGVRSLDRRKPDPAHFPLADDELLDAMREETTLFAQAIAREDRSVLEFLDGSFTYLNGPLARYYGIPGVNGEAFQRVTLKDPVRGGVITQAAILTLSSYATRTSPVLRGRWVLDNVLGTPPPPPPPDVPALKEEGVGENVSLRERLEQHRANPACAVCHNQMDPIGFGLENFDAAGQWRDRDGKFAIDASGQLPSGASFRGPGELKRALRQHPEPFLRNLTEKMLTYALGRGLETYDRPAVDKILAHLAAHEYRFSALIEGVVASAPFQGTIESKKDTDAR